MREYPYINQSGDAGGTLKMTLNEQTITEQLTRISEHYRDRVNLRVIVADLGTRQDKGGLTLATWARLYADYSEQEADAASVLDCLTRLAVRMAHGRPVLSQKWKAAQRMIEDLEQEQNVA